jgi:hypothetical protein
MLKKKKMITGPIEEDTFTTLKVRDMSKNQMYLIRKKSMNPERKIHI